MRRMVRMGLLVLRTPEDAVVQTEHVEGGHGSDTSHNPTYHRTVLEAGNAQHPFTAIIGGSKVSSKLAVLENLLGKVDNLIICGGMGYTFIKAEGGSIGNSLHEDDLIPQAKEIMAKAQELGVNVSLSVQTRITQEFSNDAPFKEVPSHQIPDGWEGMDCGTASIENWARIILASKTILWNGPAGVFEMPSFAVGTEKIAELVAEATAHGAYSLVGGGAMLEAIEGKTLP